jgi:hypothetical protein
MGYLKRIFVVAFVVVKSILFDFPKGISPCGRGELMRDERGHRKGINNDAQRFKN